VLNWSILACRAFKGHIISPALIGRWLKRLKTHLLSLNSETAYTLAAVV
jgi:hypothetical protein